jgi:hypothetical protein
MPTLRALLRHLIVATAMLLATGVATAAAQDCGGPFRPCLTDPWTASPDPGGDESRNVAIPPPDARLFGFNTQRFEEHDLNRMDPAGEIALGRHLGSQVQRYTVHWNGLQGAEGDPPLPAADHSTLRLYDEMYSALIAASMKPVIAILAAPAWANPGLDRELRNRADTILYPDAAHVDDYARFVAAVAARYPLAAIEPWNEPNIEFFWPNGNSLAETADRMKRMQCDAYRAVKALAVPNLVAAPGLAVNVNSDHPDHIRYETYADRMYSRPNPLGECMDVLSIHTYPQNQELGPETPFATEWKVVRSLRVKHDDATPIWVTETGSTTVSGNRRRFTPEDQCLLNVKLYNRLMTMEDVRMVVFHTLTDDTRPFEEGLGRNFGFFRGPEVNHSLKPVAQAFRAKATGQPVAC